MKRIIALDFGLKRTGIAITDESNIFAFAHDTVSSQELNVYLEKLIKDKNIGTIVVGEPKRLSTEDTHISENVRHLVEYLKSTFSELNIEVFDERFTSKMAMQSLNQSGQMKKVKQDKSIIDAVSATILLQSYLSSKNF